MFRWCIIIFFFKQKTAYEMRISDWSSDVCSSDLGGRYPYQDCAGCLAFPSAHRVQTPQDRFHLMTASDNPFAILKASTRDRKVRLNALADEAALYCDPAAAGNARNYLQDPPPRLHAGVAWFPGVSPEQHPPPPTHI